MDLEKQRLMEELKGKIQELEAKETRIKVELEHIELEKAQLFKQLTQYSDEKYEQDVLAMLYEQRRGKK